MHARGLTGCMYKAFVASGMSVKRRRSKRKGDTKSDDSGGSEGGGSGGDDGGIVDDDPDDEGEELQRTISALTDYEYVINELSLIHI